MTIEEEFFKRFGIEKGYRFQVKDMGLFHYADKQMLIDNKHWFMDKERRRSRRLQVVNVYKVFPVITAEKLLQLICIANNYPLNREILKNEVLEKLLFLESNKFTRDDIRPQIRKLFEE